MFGNNLSHFRLKDAQAIYSKRALKQNPIVYICDTVTRSPNGQMKNTI
jgi:hypothetical protein